MVRTNEPVRAARLPQRGSGSPGADRLKGFVALLAILAIVGGVPYVLLRFFGTPWPDKIPSRDVLFSELSIETVLGIIAFFIWVAWLHFVVCLIAEAVAEIKGHGLSPRVPLGGGSQALARRLIGTVVLIAAGAGVSLPVASAVTTERPGCSDRGVGAARQRADLGLAVPSDRAGQQGADRSGEDDHRRTDEPRPQGSGHQVHRGPSAVGPELRLPVGHRGAVPRRRPPVQGDLRPQQEQAAARRAPADQPGPDPAGLAGAAAG